jgi:uncharacterized protein YdhG (YjbR/CyaY superfamily)
MVRRASVEAYIEAAPLPVQPMLRDLRGLIRTSVPSLTERIRYGMPAYDLQGQRFVHFAAAKSHVGVYGLIHEDRDVPPDLEPYLRWRSTLRFPLDQPLPTAALAAALRRKAARFREAE